MENYEFGNETVAETGGNFTIAYEQEQFENQKYETIEIKSKILENTLPSKKDYYFINKILRFRQNNLVNILTAIEEEDV